MSMKKFYTLALVSVMALPLAAQTTSLHRLSPILSGNIMRAESLPGLSDIISEQPEGTLYKDLNHYFEGCYVSSDNYVYDYLGDGYVSDIVKGDDGCLYIKNPFGFLGLEKNEAIWIKATKGADNTYEVHLPQAVYDNGDGDDPILYAWRYVKNGGTSYADIDKESQTVVFELRNDSLIKVGDEKAFIGLGAADGYFYGYGDTVSIYNKVKDVPPVPTNIADAVEYKLTYNDSKDETAGKTIRVVFDGNVVYFGDFDDTQTDLWFSGTIDGNRLRLNKWQYMGIDRNNTTYGLGQSGHMYLYPFGWGTFTDKDNNQKYGLYEVEDPTLDYDATTKTFSTNELTLAINRGHNYYPYVYYSKPTLTPASLAGVNDVEADDVKHVVYSDLSGRRLLRAAKGVIVKTIITTDGKHKSVKQVVK